MAWCRRNISRTCPRIGESEQQQGIGTHEFAPYRAQIEWQIAAGKWADLLDAFYQVLPFGTGGRRGAVGIGPNF